MKNFVISVFASMLLAFVFSSANAEEKTTAPHGTIKKNYPNGEIMQCDNGSWERFIRNIPFVYDIQGLISGPTITTEDGKTLYCGLKS